MTGESQQVFSVDDLLLEAPNWTLDGRSLILNGDGRLWRLDLNDSPDGGSLEASLENIPLVGVPELNNDHVLAPDGQHIFLSANDGHIYRSKLQGGPASRITADDGFFHFLHGVRPDGHELAYVGIEAGDFTRPGSIMTIPSCGGPPTPIATHMPGSDQGHCDGPEYSPDGEWLYFNTEACTSEPGHAQLARVPARPGTGGEIERLLTSDTVDWFPHLSPDARFASYLRFPAGTKGHPSDLPVDVVVVSTTDWTKPLHTFALFGGQGTLNVNSWAPDSTKFAYVAYPVEKANGDE